jgi:hypothetical protein
LSTISRSEFFNGHVCCGELERGAAIKAAQSSPSINPLCDKVKIELRCERSIVLDRKTIEEKHYVEGIALVVDINGSEKLIGVGEDGLTAQFFRDLLCGGIHAVEEHGGSVIAYTGDGFQAILPDEDAAAHGSWGIARDLRKTREYLGHTKGGEPWIWPQLDIGVGLKIGIEDGPTAHWVIWTVLCSIAN